MENNIRKAKGSKDGNILQRVLKEAGVPELIEILTKRISPSDLQSLLLAVYDKRAASLTPTEVLKQFVSNRFVKMPAMSPEEVMKFDLMAAACLPEGFEMLELSPVCPLGTCSVLAPVDQKLALTTIRNTEVCSDSTNVLALESATRKMAKKDRGNTDLVKLCASHRLTRSQVFKGPASFAHFRVFSLTTAGRDSGNHGFEIRALIEHIDFYLRLLQTAGKNGYWVNKTRLILIPLDNQAKEVAEDGILKEIRLRYCDVHFSVDSGKESRGDYYEQFRFQIFGTSQDGTEYNLVDGGLTGWMKKLMNNRKERFMISGIGTDRFLSCFRETAGR